jgi:hypothetical protein
MKAVVTNQEIGKMAEQTIQDLQKAAAVREQKKDVLLRGSAERAWRSFQLLKRENIPGRAARIQNIRGTLGDAGFPVPDFAKNASIHPRTEDLSFYNIPSEQFVNRAHVWSLRWDLPDVDAFMQESWITEPEDFNLLSTHFDRFLGNFSAIEKKFFRELGAVVPKKAGQEWEDAVAERIKQGPAEDHQAEAMTDRAWKSLQACLDGLPELAEALFSVLDEVEACGFSRVLDAELSRRGKTCRAFYPNTGRTDGHSVVLTVAEDAPFLVVSETGDKAEVCLTVSEGQLDKNIRMTFPCSMNREWFEKYLEESPLPRDKTAGFLAEEFETFRMFRQGAAENLVSAVNDILTPYILNMDGPEEAKEPAEEAERD